MNYFVTEKELNSIQQFLEKNARQFKTKDYQQIIITVKELLELLSSILNDEKIKDYFFFEKLLQDEQFRQTVDKYIYLAKDSEVQKAIRN